VAGPTDISSLASWCTSTTGLFDATSGGSAVTTDLATIAGWLPTAGSVSARITQPTAGNRPVYDAVKQGVALAVGPQGGNRFFLPNAFTIDRQAFSMFVVCELTTLRRGIAGADNLRDYQTLLFGTGDNPDFYFKGTGADKGKLAFFSGGELPVNAIPRAGTRLLLGWTLGASAASVWINGTKVTRAALASGSGIVPVSLFSGNPDAYPFQATIFDLMIYNKEVSDSEVTTTLYPYAQTRGVRSSYTGQLVCVGDSNTQGFGVSANRGWAQKLTGLGARRLCISAEYAIQLDTLYTERAFEQGLIIPGERNDLVLFAGTNDIANAAKTGAQVYAQQKQYADAWRAACTAAGATGNVYGVCPLARGAGAIAGQYLTLQNLMKADASAAFNAAVAVPMDNATFNAAWGDGQFDTDDIHYNDAGCTLYVHPPIQAMLESAGALSSAATGETRRGKFLRSPFSRPVFGGGPADSEF
jgi:hypothetical protein